MRTRKPASGHASRAKGEAPRACAQAHHRASGPPLDQARLRHVRHGEELPGGGGQGAGLSKPGSEANCRYSEAAGWLGCESGHLTAGSRPSWYRASEQKSQRAPGPEGQRARGPHGLSAEPESRSVTELGRWSERAAVAGRPPDRRLQDSGASSARSASRSGTDDESSGCWRRSDVMPAGQLYTNSHALTEGKAMAA